MCGIWAVLKFKNEYLNSFNKIRHRGPDVSNYKIINDVFLGFHRLSIMDTSNHGWQPLSSYDTHVLNNGEIYNYTNFTSVHEKCDTYAILNLFKSMDEDDYGKIFNAFDGVFATIVYQDNRLIVARDPIGVRPLFYGICNGSYAFSSEYKGLSDFCEDIKPFPPGHYYMSDKNEFYCYYNYIYNGINIKEENILHNQIKTRLINGVEKRLMGDRPIGLFLSGGLDSSLIAGITRYLWPYVKLHTFSIGTEGSPDILCARKVAEYINSVHHEIIITLEDMWDVIPEVIRIIETFDTTTIRASTPMYLLSKYIKENTDITVLLSGESPDETCGGYLYFGNAPNKEEFGKENMRLLKNLYYYDVLRTDRTTAANGLEVRVPFLDLRFLDLVMGINPKYKVHTKDRCEKYMIRKAFEEMKLIPNEILWRRKEAFSDGVSKKETSWHSYVKSRVDDIYTDDIYELKCLEINYMKPRTKEELFYRIIFEKNYGKNYSNILDFWMPNQDWFEEKLNDPSARSLKVY